jgi:serine/threonine protein phosphatase PrpC
LNDMVEDDEIACILQQADSLQQAADDLVQMANDNGGWDNISVILVKVPSDNSSAQGRWHKLRNWLK